MSLKLIALAAVAALALSSCSTSYDQETKDGLRQHVVTVSEASAAGDWPTAIAELDALASEAAAAYKAGKIDDDRLENITLAMELVRQDLDSAIAAAEQEAERIRLQEQQAQLQGQIDQLQAETDSNSGPEDDPGNHGEKAGKKDKGGDQKGGGEGKGKGKGD
ncbi:hypothetical protein [Agromyces sp. NPDC057865]|uniref:hypothetical protein n=1 Tax=Agromyces sp. NPDC057865 TaxID=3346267 RepID=UPI00366CFE03